MQGTLYKTQELNPSKEGWEVKSVIQARSQDWPSEGKKLKDKADT